MERRRYTDLSDDMANYLAANPDVDAKFSALPYSHQKEYAMWIDSAKKAETRARRLDDMARRLAERNGTNPGRNDKLVAERDCVDTTKFQTIVQILASYGPAPTAAVTSALAMIVWENVAYLADDERRLKAYRLLETSVGIEAQALLSASDDALMAVAQFGIVPEQTVGKLRRIGEIAASEFPDGLDAVLTLPVKQAIKALKKFPAIGDPAAEKILLFTHTAPILALESNGLRVLQRIGYGTTTSNYTSDYRSVQKATSPELPSGCQSLIDAHILLRRHGQNVCRRSVPECGGCRLRDLCDYAAASG